MADQGTTPGLFERISGRAQIAAHQLRIRSALNPMLWLCGIVSLPCFVFSIVLLAFLPTKLEKLAIILVLVGIAPIAVAIIGFFYFMIFAPHRLQSEEYQIRHEALELIKEKGSPIEISPSSLDAITNPVRPALPGGGSE